MHGIWLKDVLTYVHVYSVIAVFVTCSLSSQSNFSIYAAIRTFPSLLDWINLMEQDKCMQHSVLVSRLCQVRQIHICFSVISFTSCKKSNYLWVFIFICLFLCVTIYFDETWFLFSLIWFGMVWFGLVFCTYFTCKFICLSSLQKTKINGLLSTFSHWMNKSCIQYIWLSVTRDKCHLIGMPIKTKSRKAAKNKWCVKSEALLIFGCWFFCNTYNIVI